MKEPTAFARGTTLGNTVFYMGSLVTFLAKGADTGGRFALMEYQAKPGNEPPPHYHEWEHEFYYVQEGELEFYCENKLLTAKAGESIFLPQGKPHAMRIMSPQLRALLLVQATGEHAVGLDSYFLEMSKPATSLELPTEEATYAEVDLAHAIARSQANGVVALSPEETAAALPHYPGFGR